MITVNAMQISPAESNQYGHLLLLASPEVRSDPAASLIMIARQGTSAGNSHKQKKGSALRNIMLLMALNSSGIVNFTLKSTKSLFSSTGNIVNLGMLCVDLLM